LQADAALRQHHLDNPDGQPGGQFCPEAENA
jgi:hypothetical protein